MSEMKTLKFPGDAQPREIVDAKAREDISLLSEEISGKQDTINDIETIRSNANSALQEHQPIKTINGESLVGKGDIQISIDGMTDAQKAMLQGKLTITSTAPVTDGTYTYYLDPDTKILYKLVSSQWIKFTVFTTKDFNVAENITGATYNKFSDNQLEILTDKYCSGSSTSGPVGSYAGAISGKVTVAPGTRFFYGIEANLTNINNFGKISFCDSENNVISKTVSLIYSAENNLSYLDMVVPDGCIYIYFPIRLNDSYSFTNKYIVGYITNENENATIFKEKIWLAMGDSLTEKNMRAGKNYHDYIAEKTGIKVINAGVSGTGYKNGITNENNFASRILNYADTNFDIVTVFGSGNDIGVTLGTEKDTGTDTIGGLVNLFLDNLYSIKPFVKVGIISPCPWQNYTPDVDDNYMLNYSELLQKIAKRRGIPFLDLYYSSGLHPDKSDFRAKFYADDGPGGVGSIDGIHPNSKGHEILASHVLAFLKTMMLH